MYVRDIAGTAIGTVAGTGYRIQGIAFKVLASPASAVSALGFSRAGVIESLTPLYEGTDASTSVVGYLVVFSESPNAIPFTSNASSPGDQIGTLDVTFDNLAVGATEVALTFEVATATLSNQAGIVSETVANGKLSLVNGSATVLRAASSTTVASSPNPSFVGQPVSLVAQVVSTAAGTIAGSVNFASDGVPIGRASVSSGRATLTTTTLPVGTHVVTAAYIGDISFLPSQSAPISQVVNVVPSGPPPWLAAMAISQTAVRIAWLPVSGVTGYEIYRKSGGGEILLATTGDTSFIDMQVEPGRTYFYRLRSSWTGAVSQFSGYDPATTINFTDDPLLSRITVARAAHISELRIAVNSFRAAAGLVAATFEDDPLLGTAIRAHHIDQLRTALADALSNMSLPAASLEDATLTPTFTLVKAAHVQQLRDAMK